MRRIKFLVFFALLFALLAVLPGCAGVKAPAPEAPVNASAVSGGGITFNLNIFGYGDWPVPGAVYLPYGGRWPRWVEGRWFLSCPWGSRGPCRHVWTPGHYE